MNLGADFSEDRKYRYRLWRYWGRSGTMLMWIMLNPSTANEFKDDPTIRRVMGYSLNWGFSGCEIFNLFAWRATQPAGLFQSEDPVGPMNDQMILEGAYKGRQIVCAWGNLNDKLAWREKELLMILDGKDLQCLKITKRGSPAHPLYLSSKLKLTEMWMRPQV